MPDRMFEDPRLAAIYDALDDDRSDLDVYRDVAAELGAREALDIGCGTGTFACLLAGDGLEVTAVDPAAAMLAVARRKRGAQLVRWICGVVSDVPPLRVDLVTMTGNVAQVFLDDDEWVATLGTAREVLGPGGWLVFETRRPDRRAWLDWNPEQSLRRIQLDGGGLVEAWTEVTRVALPFVTFRGTITFGGDGDVLTSESTLRFRTRSEITSALDVTGFDVIDVRDAPDRPGNEHVFVARRR